MGRSNDAVTLYLEQIARIPLLTKDQEIILGRQVQDWMAIRDLPDIEQINLLDTKQSAALAKEKITDKRRVSRIGQRAFNKMYEANLRLVVSIAKKYRHMTTQLELLDLIQEGNIGLKRAVEKFDPSLGYKFSTYSYWWIRQSITRAISEFDRTIRMPSHMHEKLLKVKKFTREFLQENGQAPTTEETIEKFGVSRKEFDLMVILYQGCSSLDKMHADSETALLDILPSEEVYGDEVIESEEENQVRDQLPLLLPSILNDQEMKVIGMRYSPGNPDAVLMPLTEIGRQMGVTRERARQIEVKAINKAKIHMRRLKAHPLVVA